jgi:hypothetical protein
MIGQDTRVSSEDTSRDRTGPVRHVVTLEAFACAVHLADGVALADLPPIAELEVRTRNSCYRITVVDPAESRILIQGGSFFPLPRLARLGGASLGGSLLKLGWIGYGFSLEIHADGTSIVTTPVCEIRQQTAPLVAQPS